MTADLPLMKNVTPQLAKSVLLKLGLSAGMSSSRCSYSKEDLRIRSTALIIPNEEMNGYNESGLLMKGD